MHNDFFTKSALDVINQRIGNYGYFSVFNETDEEIEIYTKVDVWKIEVLVSGIINRDGMYYWHYYRHWPRWRVNFASEKIDDVILSIDEFLKLTVTKNGPSEGWLSDWKYLLEQQAETMYAKAINKNWHKILPIDEIKK